LVFYGGEYQNGAALSAAELQFSNKEENSLKQFISLIEMAMNMGLKGKKSTSSGIDESPEEHSDDTKIEKVEIEELEEPAPPPPPKPKTKEAPRKKNQ